MKLNFDYKSVFKRIVKNTSLLLLLALLVLIVAEILVVKKVVTIALRANDKPEILQTKAVRVNFKLYESLDRKSVV